jgi:hypothetical protein
VVTYSEKAKAAFRNGQTKLVEQLLSAQKIVDTAHAASGALRNTRRLPDPNVSGRSAAPPTGSIGSVLD